MKKTEFRDELLEMLAYYFDCDSTGINQIDFTYDKDENHGELIFRNKKKDTTLKIKL